MKVYYAQNKEDLLIKSFFPDVQEGFYIDIGANDPVIDSVTKLVYDEGWRGINVEPIKRHYESLKRARPRDTTIHAGVGATSGNLVFTEYQEGDGLSTFDTSMQKFYEGRNHTFNTKKHKKYEVSVKTLQQIIEEQDTKHVHFIKIDVEGYEAEVIAGYDWKKIRPELICIEANHIRTNNDWETVLKKNRYQEVFFDGLNKYYLAEESLGRKEYFSYPDAAFSGNPIYYQAFLEAEAVISEPLLRTISDKEQEISILHQQQRDVRFLAKRLAAETQTRLNKRAKGVVVTDHLKYRQDPSVDNFVLTADKVQVLAQVHELDKRNIYSGTVALKDQLKPLGWKAAAGIFNSSLRVARRVRGGR